MFDSIVLYGTAFSSTTLTLHNPNIFLNTSNWKKPDLAYDINLKKCIDSTHH